LRPALLEPGFCIAVGVAIIPSNHIFTDANALVPQQVNVGKDVWIKDDVWIVTNCMILDGVKIGQGSLDQEPQIIYFI